MTDDFTFSIAETIQAIRLEDHSFTCLIGFMSAWNNVHNKTLTQKGALTAINPDAQSPIAAVSLMSKGVYHAISPRGPFDLALTSEEILVAIPRDEKKFQEDILLDLYEAYDRKSPRLSFLFDLLKAVPQAACTESMGHYLSVQKETSESQTRFVRNYAGDKTGRYGVAIYQRAKGEALGVTALDPFFSSQMLSAKEAIQRGFAKLFANLHRPRGCAPLQRKHFGL